MDKLFREVLAKAMELVPAEAGAVLLDDPLTKAPDPAANELHCVAAVGPAAATRVGRAVSANVGAAGWAYRTSAPYRCVGSEGAKGPSGDGDAVVVRDIIAAPIIIRESVCGALELTDRLDGKGFDEHDVVLL
ncbi:MAG: GAF domain-containing protein, partial [Gemmatimonadota bacterium]